jgi:hypothetical protein
MWLLDTRPSAKIAATLCWFDSCGDINKLKPTVMDILRWRSDHLARLWTFQLFQDCQDCQDCHFFAISPGAIWSLADQGGQKVHSLENPDPNCVTRK